MEIIFEKRDRKETKTKRHSVIVKDHTYIEILKIRDETGIPVEEIVETLLSMALMDVVIK